MKKTFFVIWISTVISLFFYSLTQIDLNLTLSRIPIILQFTKFFQNIGFYQRPFSAAIFSLILFFLFMSYFGMIILSYKKLISNREFWVLFLLTSIILLFSYPAFSYDIYNYMFDAKAVVLYHVSPWQYRPLDFPHDPWLSFMHWTHRPSVYPPVWIGLTLPFYIAGLGFFITTLLSFKLLMSLSFIGSVYLIGKMSKEKEKIINMVFFAFNPLMIIENLVSGHNDIVMMFFSLVCLWLFINKKKVWSFIFIFFSVLTKYVTALILPVLIFGIYKKIKTLSLYRISLFAVTIFFFYMISRVEIQPWYLVWLLPYIVLSGWKTLKIISIGLSVGLLLRYTPFLLFGNWDNPVPVYKIWLTVVPLVTSFGAVLLYRLKNKHNAI